MWHSTENIQLKWYKPLGRDHWMIFINLKSLLQDLFVHYLASLLAQKNLRQNHVVTACANISRTSSWELDEGASQAFKWRCTTTWWISKCIYKCTRSKVFWKMKSWHSTQHLQHLLWIHLAFQTRNNSRTKGKSLRYLLHMCCMTHKHNHMLFFTNKRSTNRHWNSILSTKQYHFYTWTMHFCC